MEMLIKYRKDILHEQSLFKDNRSESKGKRGRLYVFSMAEDSGHSEQKGI